MPDISRHPAASAGVTSTASHLSIGEVLGLLLEEFPDVTISKIRFLESQGLIEPERTPSGYRKFFDNDVELLRLILREQRENFLPLRVIKDRIDSGEILHGGETPETAETLETPEVTDVPPPRAEASTDPGRLPGFEREAPDDPPPPAAADDAAPPPEPDAEDPGEDDPAPEDEVDDPTPDDEAAERGDAGPGDEAQANQAPDVSGDLLTASELSDTVSATPGEIADLQSYGLITPREDMGEPLFDHDAVEVARICTRFLAAGVDVRHLRGWKTSADRETSVYEQLTLPLLRQRNPRGRQVARDRLVELCELGTSLRQALVDAELRHHLER